MVTTPDLRGFCMTPMELKALPSAAKNTVASSFSRDRDHHNDDHDELLDFALIN